MSSERRGWRIAPSAVLLAGALAGCSKQADVVAPTLAATCSASPASGRAPLQVGFVLNVSGAQGAVTVRINYGDGASGSDVSVPHVYTSAGNYAPSFNVSTATQSALCSTSVSVTAAAPSPTPPPATRNQAPDVVFRTNPEADSSDTLTFGYPPVTVHFNMCRSSDPEGDDLNFRMDLDGDGVFEVDGPTGADCGRQYTYTEFRTYTPTICATDLLSSRSPAHPYQCKTYRVQFR